MLYDFFIIVLCDITWRINIISYDMDTCFLVPNRFEQALNELNWKPSVGENSVNLFHSYEAVTLDVVSVKLLY